ncbi:hypothetical protein BDZ91DRAFT_134412 [Kalaharituber pfeilii]|nr:hypothetical protein BDZ91DRAFT_134412 [Kalaharituber pfeilii]
MFTIRGSIVVALLAVAVTARPQDYTIDPILPTVTVTSTITSCPVGKCTKICPTTTITVEPTGSCTFNTAGCPVARCAYQTPVTSTFTSYCKGTCTNLTTTKCDAIPSYTLVPPCPTECPELCPVPIETVAVACPTSVR